jgi:serine/threonine-protein kinase
MNLRAFTIGISAAFLALACSGSDDNNPGDNENNDPNPPVTNQPNDPNPPVTNTPNPPDTDEPSDPGDPGDISRAYVESLLRTNCGGCHGNEAEENSACRAGMCYIEDIDELVAQGKIVPGDPNASPLYQRISRGEMPPPGETVRPDEKDIADIAQFILRLNAPPPQVCNDQFMDFDDLYEAAERDILSGDLDADDREFIRYFSISNRYNAGVCDAQLEEDRWAMSKFINSISQNPQVTEPEEVAGTNGTLYRIDLRDYDLDASQGPFDPNGLVGGPFVDGWEAIIGNNDYAIEFEGDQADNIKLQANTTVPIVFSDAVIDEASVGNLYYELLRLQDNRDANLLDLEVDLVGNFDDETAVFAGTTKSEISDQERSVRRDPQDIGRGLYYYESFDLDPNVAGASIFSNPLDFDQVANGSEALFSLPNGLQGYIIYDAAGNRLEESDILFDNSQNDNVLRSMISCSTCHNTGTIPFQDEVRDFADQNPLDIAEALDLINLNVDDLEALYPGNDELREVLADDANTYRAALADAGNPTSGSDSISDTFIRFDSDVDIATFAGDLHYPAEALENDIPRLNPALSGLDNGLRVDRDDITGLYLESVCIVSVAQENQPAAAECALVGL